MASQFPGVLRRPRRSRRKRDSQPNRPQPTAAIGIVSAVKGASEITITFDQTITLKGVPQYALDLSGVDPLSADATAPNVVEITYSAAVGVATTVTIPYEESSVRNSGGGFVSDSTFTLT